MGRGGESPGPMPENGDFSNLSSLSFSSKKNIPRGMKLGPFFFSSKKIWHIGRTGGRGAQNIPAWELRSKSRSCGSRQTDIWYGKVCSGMDYIWDIEFSGKRYYLDKLKNWICIKSGFERKFSTKMIGASSNILESTFHWSHQFGDLRNPGKQSCAGETLNKKELYWGWFRFEIQNNTQMTDTQSLN